MRSNVREFLEFSDGLRFAGARTALFDSVALGLLRNRLTDDLGAKGARAALTQFGFAHGWRLAEALKRERSWASEGDWLAAGLRSPALQGLCIEQRGSPMTGEGAIVNGAFEAVQHRSTEPVCWVLCGVWSGLISRTTGVHVVVLEERCEGAGASSCQFVGKTPERWSSSRREELAAFQPTRLRAGLEPAAPPPARTTRVRSKPGLPADITANSAVMATLLATTQRVATVDATVLVTGESGTGKERIARLLHDLSPRARAPFVAINCGAVTESLLESELFGHARGAFTGAAKDRVGYFESAAGGTIFLDEIGELSLGMQVKLLRVLQERCIRRVGENRERPIDARVIAATNRDLEQALRAGTFREDLFYRLKVVDLTVPPLRTRPEDVLPLAQHFLQQWAKQTARPVRTLSPQAADALMRYPWPGNVRELENAMERAVAMAAGERLELSDLPEALRGARKPRDAPPAGRLEVLEREAILAALDRHAGNQTTAARELGIGTVTLYRKLKRYRAEK